MSRNRVPDLSSKELRAVCTVADSNSFVAASLTLNVSQAALTRIVQRVEQTVGAELFLRTTRRLEITPAGHQFIAQANQLLSDLHRACESLRESTTRSRRSITISSLCPVAYAALPKLIAASYAAVGEFEIHIRESEHTAVLDEVRSAIADFGICYIDELENEFDTIFIATESFHVLVPQDHALAERSEVSFEEAANHVLVSLSREAEIRSVVEELALSKKVRLVQYVAVGHFETLIQCVLQGLGIAIVPADVVQGAYDAGLLSRPMVEPAMGRQIGVVIPKGRHQPEMLRVLITKAREMWSNSPSGISRSVRVESNNGCCDGNSSCVTPLSSVTGEVHEILD